MKLKKISLLFFLTVTTMSAMEKRIIVPSHEIDKIDLSETTFYIPQNRVQCKGNKHLLYNKNGFLVADGKEVKAVQSYDTDKLLRNRKVNDIVKYGMLGKFRIGEFENGEYKVDAIGELNGGGPGGAAFGVFLGHALVWGTCHTGALIASLIGTPAAGVAAETAISMSSPAIEAAAMKLGIGLGIFFGAATGPL